MQAIVVLIIQIIVALIKACKNYATTGTMNGDSTESVWAGVAEAGKGVMDWWQDPEVSKTEKFSTAYGLSYLIAPDMTKSVTNRAVEAATTLTGAAIDGVGTATDQFFDFFKKRPMLTLGLVAFVVYIITRGGSRN